MSLVTANNLVNTWNLNGGFLDAAFVSTIQGSFADINYFNEKFHSDYLKLSLWDKEIKVFLDLAIKKFSQYITEEYRLQYMKVRSKSKKDNKRMM